MKANQATQRIYSLFQHPSARFTKAVGDIADQRIAAYHQTNGNGLTEEEIIAIAQQQIAQHGIDLPEDIVTYGGTISVPSDSYLTEQNLGKIFEILNDFSPEDYPGLFIDAPYDENYVYPAHTNVVVVKILDRENVINYNDESDPDPEPIFTYKFDILQGVPAEVPTPTPISVIGCADVSDPNSLMFEINDLSNLICYRVFGIFEDSSDNSQMVVEVTSLYHIVNQGPVGISMINAADPGSIVDPNSGYVFSGIASAEAIVMSEG